MKKIKKKDLGFLLKLSLLVFAISLNPSGFAIAASVQVPNIAEPGSDTDPNDGKPLEGTIHDEANKGAEQPGQGASGSAAQEAGITEDQVTDYVSQYQAYRFPLHTDFLKRARQIKVNTKEPTHYVIGEAVMEAQLKSALTNTNKDAEVVLPLYKNDEKIFPECSTILVKANLGYNEKGVADNSPLILYVEAYVKGTGVTVSALNGPLNNGEMYVPDIPAGTELLVMAPAMSESEVEIQPDTAWPLPETAYLQKKVCAVTFTDFFNAINKKVQWDQQDIKDYVLRMFRKKATRTMLISTPKKWLKTGSKKTGAEYAYAQKGILRQLRLGYQIGSTLTFADLIGMTKILFGKYSTTNEMDVYCGSNFIEKLLNIDFVRHQDITFKKSQRIGVDIASFETSFGTMNFMFEQGLDDIGLEGAAIAFAMSDSNRYYYDNGTTLNVDHNKGEGGEVRQAKSEYYIQDDCLMLTGYNSMFIGDNVAIAGYSYSQLEAVVTSVDAFSSVTNPADGQIVYLAEADGDNGVGLYEYDTEDQKWKPYNGILNDVNGVAA
jgi:hypothetical protein